MRLEAGHRLDTSLPVQRATQAWSAQARATIYSRVLGAPGATPDDPAANREFEGLWLRFVTAVSQVSRQQGLADATTRAAQSLAAQAGSRIDHAYGARLWQVIESVATTELGGAANSARYRSMALAGGAILEWLAGHPDDAGDAWHGDGALADACTQWIALNGARDEDAATLATADAARARVQAWTRSLGDAVGLPGLGAGAIADPLDTPRVAALFSGAAGTGKTLAAHLLGTALGIDVLRVDLAAVVSRYIGETEKNLDRVFGAAQDQGAALLFDEADAVFGKRTGVRDSHDRYANLEVEYLARRIGAFDGVAMLTTHHGADRIDPNLLARVDARVVVFPLPPR